MHHACQSGMRMNDCAFAIVYSQMDLPGADFEKQDISGTRPPAGICVFKAQFRGERKQSRPVSLPQSIADGQARSRGNSSQSVSDQTQTIDPGIRVAAMQPKASADQRLRCFEHAVPAPHGVNG